MTVIKITQTFNQVLILDLLDNTSLDTSNDKVNIKKIIEPFDWHEIITIINPTKVEIIDILNKIVFLFFKIKNETNIKKSIECV